MNWNEAQRILLELQAEQAKLLYKLYFANVRGPEIEKLLNQLDEIERKIKKVEEMK